MALEHFEADLLALFLKDKNKYIKFSKNLEPKHFRNKIFKWAFEVLIEFFNKYKDLPTLEVFKSELMKTSLETGDKKLYYAGIKKLLKRTSKINPKYLEENVREKIDEEEFLKAVDQALRDTESEGISKAKRDLLKKLILGEKTESFELVYILKDWKLRQILREKLSKLAIKKRFVSTPYSAINKATSGIQISEAATIAGLTSMGKSIIAGEFGVNSLLDGLNVLHFSLENTAEQTAQRYDTRLTEIEYDTLKFYKFDPSQLAHFKKVFEALGKGLSNDIVVKETVRNEADFAFIDKTIETLKLDGFETNLLVIDSCDIMRSMHSYRDYRLERASVYWDLKDYCKIKRIPGLTTTQLKVTSKWKLSTSEDLAEAYDKARILDIVYIMSQTEEDYKRNIIRFSIDKNRDGEGGAVIKLFKDAAKMRFLEVV